MKADFNSDGDIVITAEGNAEKILLKQHLGTTYLSEMDPQVIKSRVEGVHPVYLMRVRIKLSD